jgi:hypothetical protein
VTQAIIILFLFLAITMIAAPSLCKRYPVVKPKTIYYLFFYHYLFATIYYLYALFNPSDSKGYFAKIMTNYRGPDWFSFYGTSTTFIEFLGYPLIRFVGLTYESMMVLFSYFGFMSFCFFLVFFRENMKTQVKLFKMDAVLFIMFLPNFHFWTASFGKGSIISLGMALVFFSFRHVRSRFLYLLIGSLIVYHVRPHVMFIILVALVLGYLFSGSKIPIVQKVFIVACAGVVLAFIFEDVLVMTGLDEDFLNDSLSLSERAKDLQRATSGVDISNYNFFEKLFTFLYRPLFFDAPGLLGLFVSVENVIYLVLTAKLFQSGSLKFLWNSDAMVKTSLIAFIAVSIALAQISGNLGLAIRQKSQVMILLMFVILKFMDERNLAVIRKKMFMARRRKQEEMKEVNDNPVVS